MEFQTALQKAAAYCSVSEKCVSETAEKLLLWGVAKTDVEKIIEHLKNEGFINEKRYASAFVKDKFRFNGWGKKKIFYMLSAKKISNKLINEALDSIDEDEYLTALAQILQSKEKTVKTTDKYQKNAKLYNFALTRGFENEAIKKVINF